MSSDKSQYSEYCINTYKMIQITEINNNEIKLLSQFNSSAAAAAAAAAAVANIAVERTGVEHSNWTEWKRKHQISGYATNERLKVR